jgi:hypothetical protein
MKRNKKPGTEAGHFIRCSRALAAGAHGDLLVAGYFDQTNPTPILGNRK